MSRERGRRFEEPKLNMKKVIAVIVAIIVVIMFIFIIKGILSKDKDQTRISSKDYVVVFKDNKWGVIDSTGNEVISPSYEEMIIIPNSKNDVFLCIYDVNYETGEYKTKVLNSKNEEIFTQYEKVENIPNKDENGNLWYEENILKVKKDGKYGIINLTGKELTVLQYDEIISIEGVKNALKVKQNNKYGIIDNEGKEILKTEYTDVNILGTDNKSGFIVKNETNKYGILDYSNKTVLENNYDNIKKVYGNNMYVVEQSGKEILVKADGTEILTTGFDKIKSILKTEKNGIIYSKAEKYGVMKLTGEITIEPIYDDLKEAKSGIFIFKKDQKYGIIDIQKNVKVENKYNYITYNEKSDLYIAETESFENDILDNSFTVRQSGVLIEIDYERGYFELRQGDEYKYYNFKFEEKNIVEIRFKDTLFLSKKDGKYGFVDKNGNVVVDYIYDDATEQNEYGFVAVKKDGKWGSIDGKGVVSQDPIYNLDEYLKIDFIGRWHLGKDVNVNYYNQF